MLTPPSIPQERPLSPHLQIYRPQITSIVSIFHRLTGIALMLGTLPFVIWLGSLSMGPGAYLKVTLWFSSPLGITMLFGWTFCFYFHLLNGIRHLFWDIGWGFELSRVYQSGWAVIGLTGGLTLLTFWWIFL